MCLFNFYSLNPVNTPLILWNPSIKKAIVASVPVLENLEFISSGFPKLIFRVGFDSCSNIMRLFISSILMVM